MSAPLTRLSTMQVAKPVLDDFILQKVLGKGGYGKVMLVKHKNSNDVYAMKTLRKENLVKRNQVQHTQSERNVLEAVNHPFIVNLHYAFQTPSKLYMVMEYCAGGELFYHLSRAGRFSDGRCKFYTAELTLAVGYLHSLNIIYRDLKPENVLIDGSGHAKITDFGLSKEGILDNMSAKTMCGTPEYLAPEILNKAGHGKAVDWYSLGALIYEMLTGLPPFYTKNRDVLFQQIRTGTLLYPPYIAPKAEDLMKRMMDRDPEKRLGGGPTDVAEIQTHPFFQDVDWTAVYDRRTTVPFQPNLTLSGDGDVRFFEKEFVNLAVADSDAGEHGEVKHFEGFTFGGADVNI